MGSEAATAAAVTSAGAANTAPEESLARRFEPVGIIVVPGCAITDAAVRREQFDGSANDEPDDEPGFVDGGNENETLCAACR